MYLKMHLFTSYLGFYDLKKLVQIRIIRVLNEICLAPIIETNSGHERFRKFKFY